MFVRFEQDAKAAQNAVNYIIPKQMQEWNDNFGDVCAVICVSATIAPGERLQIVSNSGGYQPLVEGMAVQLLHDLMYSKSIPWMRRILYRLVWMTCGQFVVTSHRTQEVV